MRTLEEIDSSFENKNLESYTKLQESLKEILVDNTGILSVRQPTTHMKAKLFEAGLLENKCSICGLGPNYNGKQLTLHLDHIDGNPLDNRLSNLRILCPNCHSQTHTFCGRNKKSHLINKNKEPIKKNYRSKTGKIRNKRTQNTCNRCGKNTSHYTKNCKKCTGILLNPPKINWPTIEELQELLKQYNYTQLGKILGVSDNAIRKKIRNSGTNLPTSIANNKPRNNRSGS